MAMAQDCGRMLRILRDSVNQMFDADTKVDGVSVVFERNDIVDEHGQRADTEWAAEYATGFGDGKTLENAHKKLRGWVEALNENSAALHGMNTDVRLYKEETAVLHMSGDLLDEISDQSAEMTSPASAAGATKVPLLGASVEMQGPNDLEGAHGGGSLGNIGHIVGVIASDDLEALRVRLHNLVRGNAIMKHRDIEEQLYDSVKDTGVYKSCFVVYFHGQSLGEKIIKYLKAFGATIYELPETTAARNLKVQELQQDINDRATASEETNKQKFHLLSDFYEHAVTLRKFVNQEKMIYYTLNKCTDQSEDGAEYANRTITRLRAQVWCPTYAINTVRNACQIANRKCADAGSSDGNLVMIKENKVNKDEVRPTYNRTNRFTQGFQAIVDGYGIPDYMEINPTIFATAMFPFLFGVMFGDWVHGILMTTFAGFLIFNEEKFLAIEDRNEIFEYLFSGRYTIFVMGICATYMGLIYNEALSCSVDFFGTAYQYSYICQSSVGNGDPTLFPDYAGVRGADWRGYAQYSAKGCTKETMKDSNKGVGTDNCWHLLADYYEQLPCGVTSTFPCSQEIRDAMNTCQAGLVTSTTTLTIKTESFVVPSGHGSDHFLPGDVGQPHGNNTHTSNLATVPAKRSLTPYVFGVDPVWRYSSQNIQFTNSLKMKMSVILGVSQMIVGIILKWINTIHFEKWGYLGAVCVPELLFMSCTFGYMCFLIFLKWSTDYTQGIAGAGQPCWESCPDYGTAADYKGMGCYREPPMIITTLIGMFMSTGAVGQDQTETFDRCKFYLFESQQGLQLFFLLVALICVPWLFAVEPILVHREHQAEMRHKERAGIIAHTSEDSAEDEIILDEDGEEEDDFSMGDVIVGQAIHAIEFILGAVSNTASYLRLWALSLAHSQLSEVFWEYIFKGYEIELLGGQYPGLASGNVFFIIVCYAVFFCCTIAVLMVMESLSAFLHALRLQWVEFQNKFYHATGYKFTPLDFEGESIDFD